VDMSFGTWSFYREESLMTVSRELFKYKLDLVGVQEVRWKGDGTKPCKRIHILLWKGE
jgi:hypothetical protein